MTFFLQRKVTVFLKIIRINCKERRFQRRLKSAIATVGVRVVE